MRSPSWLRTQYIAKADLELLGTPFPLSEGWEKGPAITLAIFFLQGQGIGQMVQVTKAWEESLLELDPWDPHGKRGNSHHLCIASTCVMSLM